MRKTLKHLYKDSKIGHWIISPAKRLYDYYGPRILTERMYKKQTFKNTFGYELNLNNPKTLNEKIQWLQLNDRTPQYIKCTDKLAVREYVKEKIGQQYLIALIFNTEKSTDLIPENFPNYPFIIKTNHGSGGHIIVQDKTIVNWKKVQKHFNKLIKTNFYYKSKEWQYKNIHPRIFGEKLLVDKHFNPPHDYKIFCLNGKAVFIEVLTDRQFESKINYYDSDWNRINCYGTRNKTGEGVEKPKNFSEMKILAEKLAGDFYFVRIDLYFIDNLIYFSEMTFSPAGGFELFNPTKWDRIFGNELKL